MFASCSRLLCNKALLRQYRFNSGNRRKSGLNRLISDVQTAYGWDGMFSLAAASVGFVSLSIMLGTYPVYARFNRSFDKMEEHFDKMDVHFDKMDYHFNELMDQLINQQKWYMDQVDKQNKKFEKLNQKLENQRMHSVSQDRD